ncbi:MAG TPA: sulfotransferase [bacterium]|nr:sulfotransferase [bacterium]
MGAFKTSPNRVNLFVIGVNKAGTSWLYYLLNEHPDIYMSEVKELYYFGNEYPNNLADYHKHFPFDESYSYYGEATPVYYREEEIAEQIHKYSPAARLVAIIRDPVERTLSQFYFHKQLGILREDTTFEDAINRQDPALVQDSHYEESLSVYQKIFEDEQLKIVSLEAAKESPKKFWKNLLNFLDLDHVAISEQQSRSENVTGSPLFRKIYRGTIRPIKRRNPGLYNVLLKSSFMRWSKSVLLKVLGAAQKEDVRMRTKERLYREFEPTYTYLEEIGHGDVYHWSIE